MTTFADNLKKIPPVDTVIRVEFPDGENPIENKPGQAGSLAVYCHLLRTFGSINASAARKGIALYAEHGLDAAKNPGKHPNIDRLFRVIEQGLDIPANIREENNEN